MTGAQEFSQPQHKGAGLAGGFMGQGAKGPPQAASVASEIA